MNAHEFQSDLRIRSARPDDAAALCGLLAELGYPLDTPLLLGRLAELSAAGAQALVAEYAGQVIGLVVLDRTHFLHRAPDGRVVTLVVTSAYRRRGIGPQLLQAADRVFKHWGCGRVEVSSGFQREAAHRFYRREGYEEQSKRFVKPVAG
jgi:GNAT superfamily N-acetyltransferase